MLPGPAYDGDRDFSQLTRSRRGRGSAEPEICKPWSWLVDEQGYPSRESGGTGRRARLRIIDPDPVRIGGDTHTSLSGAGLSVVRASPASPEVPRFSPVIPQRFSNIDFESLRARSRFSTLSPTGPLPLTEVATHRGSPFVPMKRLVAVLACGIAAAIGFVYLTTPISTIDDARFQPLHRSAKAIVAATSVGVNVAEFSRLVQSMATELSIASEHTRGLWEKTLLQAYSELLRI